MHIVHGELRKAPFVKVLQDSTMFALELSEMIKDYKTGEKTYTNYKAILFAKTDAHINYYNQALVEGNFVVLTSEKLKVEVSECGQYIKLFMDNARLEGSGYVGAQSNQQQPVNNHQQGGYQQQQQQPVQQQGGYQQSIQQQQQQQPVNNGQQQAQPQQGQQQQNASFDDDIPFAPIGLQYPALLNM